MSKPLVSTVIPTHNRAELLPRALDSIINQSYPNIEVVVVDDGSKDNTPNIIEHYRNKYPINYIRFKESQGAGNARNQGIKYAKGIFIAGLDDDDAWHKDRLSELMKHYSDNFSMVTSDNLIIYPQKKIVWKKRRIIDLNTLLYSNQVGNQGLVKRERLLDVGGFDTNLAVGVEDYDLWVRLCSKFGPIRNVQKPLQTIYMDHGKERITDRSFKSHLQFYDKHKHRFNCNQRRYQLYKIRRLQGKNNSITEFLTRVPIFKWSKEIKQILIDKFWQ